MQSQVSNESRDSAAHTAWGPPPLAMVVVVERQGAAGDISMVCGWVGG